ncbi:hypothetical protein [Dactylosporangium darangshiense]
MGIVGIALVLVVFGCICGLVSVPQLAMRNGAKREERAERRAREELPVAARSFADQVVEAARTRSGPDDAALWDITQHPRCCDSVRVWVAGRAPDLTLVVYTRAPYGVLFGTADVDACFRLAFHDLGGPAARYDLDPADPCPTGLPLVSPNPSPSVS